VKNQYRTTRHCPPKDLPNHFEALIDGVVYKFAKFVWQPEPNTIPDNSLVYAVYIEDGLIQSSTQTTKKVET